MTSALDRASWMGRGSRSSARITGTSAARAAPGCSGSGRVGLGARTLSFCSGIDAPSGMNESGARNWRATRTTGANPPNGASGRQESSCHSKGTPVATAITASRATN